ncbi:HTH-type transcriptional activator tipA [Solibacillus isronensis B3W22]|uniref:HTH-type transcriptional activator tipA n=1 Tax=Solibacillus isronensis B3W22 TaxID=1224748 RepID=K1KVA5_9BACL|nr:MerR family transcriptional regulator [Solibacillus isronensis]AMO85814.1 transcriptional regulator [Solibacillus silvestris]EKB46471.1 HTH-type transcriptional activator tipA [Solibacillus isronensis B3W22]
MKRWTTGEVSKQRNISMRTLRYYDQIDLLTPSFKDEHGKRYYSEEDLFTLEKIIILKSFSLPLEEIRILLDKLTYKQILISHYNHLQEQLSKLQTSIANTTSLINMIDVEHDLSWEHVSKLVHRSQTTAKNWIDYFQYDEKVLLQKIIPSLSHNDVITHQYIVLLNEIESYIKQGIQAESKQGIEIAKKLIKLSDETFQGDDHLIEKFWEVRKLPDEETGLYPISKDVLEFVERCIEYATANPFE